MKRSGTGPRKGFEHGEIRRGMRPLSSLLPFQEALRMAVDLARPIRRTEAVSVRDAAGRVLAEDVHAPFDVPLADRAAMDGYAVVALDTRGARKEKPTILRRIGTLYAGDAPRMRVSAGQCVEIATGATIPSGADAVVMVEHTMREGDAVIIRSPIQAGRNVSPRGEDIRAGSQVVRRGERLSPAKVGALAAIGMPRVRVYARPRVAVFTTGDEVVPPGRRIRPGQVYDVNSYTLASVVRESGGEPVLLGRAGDRPEALRSVLAKALRADLVVSSGGSSVGEKDLLADLVRERGQLRFHGIAMKPGRPTVLGRIRGTPVLGMPGYPTSCLSNAYVLLVPMLRRMARLPPDAPRTLELPLAETVRSPPGKVEFHPVRVVDGRAVSASRGSSAITSMAHADGYVEIPAHVDRIEKGAPVRVVLFGGQGYGT